MEAMNHLPFIVGSYVAAFVIVAGLVSWVMIDYRTQRRALAELELRGLKRRSASVRPERPMTEANEKA
jgi:heme exporter protein D